MDYRVDDHWSRLGDFLLPKDGVIIIDGVGLCSHAGLARLYWALSHDGFDDESFKAFEESIAGGWIWPPKPILFGSTS